MLAALAIETGIAPAALLAEPPDVLDAMVDLLAERAEQEKTGQTRDDLRNRLKASMGRS